MARWDRRTRLTAELGLDNNTRMGLASAQRGFQGFFSNVSRSAGMASAGIGGAISGNAAFAAAAGGAALVTFGVQAVTQFADIEKKWLEVTTLMPQATEGALASMKRQIDQFARREGVTLADAYNAAYQAISAGVDPQLTPSFLETAHTAALGGVTDLTTSVDALTSVINAYGLSVSDANWVSDVFFTTILGGKTTFRELGPVIGQLLPIANELGVSFDQVGAAFQVLTSMGLPTRQAATQILQLLNQLAKGDTATLFQTITGETFGQWQASGGSLRGAVVEIRREADRTGKNLLEMFASVEAGNAAAALSAEKMAGKWQDAMDIVEGSTEAAAARFEDSVSRRLDRFNAMIEQWKTQAVEAFIFVTQDVANAQARDAEWFAEYEQQKQDEVKASVAGQRAQIQGLYDFLQGFYGKWVGEAQKAAEAEVAITAAKTARIAALHLRSRATPSVVNPLQALAQGFQGFAPSLDFTYTWGTPLDPFFNAGVDGGAGGGGGRGRLTKAVEDNTAAVMRLTEQMEQQEQFEVAPGETPVLPEFLQSSELRYISRLVQNKLVGGVVS